MDDLNRIVGANIRTARKARHLTQMELGRMVDLVYSGISKVETGKTGVSLETLVKMVSALDTSADVLLGIVRSDNDIVDDLLLRTLSSISDAKENLGEIARTRGLLTERSADDADSDMR